MANENFTTIQSKKDLIDSDKMLIGSSGGDYSTRLLDLKNFIDIDPGKKLLIYYSTPLAINGAWDVSKAAMEFSFYDYIVFGNDLESLANPEHLNLTFVVDELKRIKPSVRLFGYIDAGVTTTNLSVSQIELKVNDWKTSGITDIFLDDMGFDFEVNRTRQNDILNTVHSYDMFAMINAWDPDEVFSDSINDYQSEVPADPSTVIPGDLYLSESFLYNNTSSVYSSNDNFATQNNFKTKEDKVIFYTKLLGIIPCACDILQPGEFNSERIIKYLNVAALTMGKKVYGIQSQGYCATNGTTFDKYSTDHLPLESIVPDFKEFSKLTYTPNIIYNLDGTWIKFTRYQGGVSLGFCLSDGMMNDITSVEELYKFYVCEKKYINLNSVLDLIQQAAHPI